MTTPQKPEGLIEASVASIGVVDHDKDLLAPGSIAEGSVCVISSWGHNSMLNRVVPVGVGTLHIVGNEVRLKGRLLVDEIPEARSTLAIIRALGEHAEWSFGYFIQQRRDPTPDERSRGAQQVLVKVDAFEASPVSRGAGISTRTIAAKRNRELGARAAAMARATLLKIGWDSFEPHLIRWRCEDDDTYLRRIGFANLTKH